MPTLKSSLRAALSAVASLATALLFAACGGASGQVTLARLAENQDSYLGKRVSTSGTVEAQTNADGSRYYVLTDAEGDLVALLPDRLARRYDDRRVSVDGRFGFDPKAGRLIRIGRISSQP